MASARMIEMPVMAHGQQIGTVRVEEARAPIKPGYVFTLGYVTTERAPDGEVLANKPVSVGMVSDESIGTASGATTAFR